MAGFNLENGYQNAKFTKIYPLQNYLLYGILIVESMPKEEDPVVQLFTQEVGSGNEDCASDILRNNYSALSQSITEPVRVARLLHEEVISDEALSCVMSTRGSVSDSRAVLLKAVRDAVHSNYKHLELLVTVLRKFSETAHIGDTIFEEYSKL